VESNATRLWKKLSREERLAAARHFFDQPPAELLGQALAALVKARHLRPQVARSMPPDEQARALAAVGDPGEAVAGGLVVALHIAERRELLKTFLDAAGLPHEDGLLKDDDAGEEPLAEDAGRKGVEALARSFPKEQVEVYLNALWLQDPDRWRVLERSDEWL
jgi:hypothetical protein